MNSAPTPGPSAVSGTSEQRRWARRLAITCGLCLLPFIVVSSAVIVPETEYVVVERLGQIRAVYDRPGDRGLHFKLPWPIDVARRFDSRVRLFDPPGREVFTSDRKNITIDAFVCWRIADGSRVTGDSDAEHPVIRFYRGLGTPEVAEARLESRIRSVLNTAIGQLELSDLLTAQDAQSGPQDGHASLLNLLATQVLDQIQATDVGGTSLGEKTGIELIDLRIKRINFPAGNQQAVFERMRSERQKIAEGYRSAGLAENSVIRSAADRHYQEIMARAEAEAEKIRGAAEAEAIGLLNASYAADPEFFEVTRTLDAYRQIIGNQTTLVLSASSPLFRLLSDGISPPSPSNPLPERERQPEDRSNPVPTPNSTNELLP